MEDGAIAAGCGAANDKRRSSSRFMFYVFGYIRAVHRSHAAVSGAIFVVKK